MDADAKEVIQKVQALVAKAFGGDYAAAFKHYDMDGNSKLGPKDLWVLLADAGVGNVLTRKSWVNGIIQQLDKDGDGAISIPELTVAFMEGIAFAPKT